MSLSYAWDRARLTLQHLATVDAPLARRLEDAYFVGLLRILPGEDLPAELRPRHAAVAAQLKRVQGEPGSAAAKVAALGPEEQRRLAEDVVDLCLGIGAALAREAPEEFG